MVTVTIVTVLVTVTMTCLKDTKVSSRNQVDLGKRLTIQIEQCLPEQVMEGT